MNIFLLKTIALISMIIDHYGVIFHDGVFAYRIIGRLAFPIYAFLLVEGYSHTKNVKKYAKRLLLFALISEVPFDLAFYNGISLTHQNIFFTLFIGLMMMYFLDNQDKYNLDTLSILSLGIFAAIFLFVDYNFLGIVYILAFFYTRDMDSPKKIFKVAVAIFMVNLLTFSSIQHFSILSLPLLYFYNGKLGPQNKFIQILFYIAYPLHLIIFYLIQTSI